MILYIIFFYIIFNMFYTINMYKLSILNTILYFPVLYFSWNIIIKLLESFSTQQVFPSKFARIAGPPPSKPWFTGYLGQLGHQGPGEQRFRQWSVSIDIDISGILSLSRQRLQKLRFWRRRMWLSTIFCERLENQRMGYHGLPSSYSKDGVAI